MLLNLVNLHLPGAPVSLETDPRGAEEAFWTLPGSENSGYGFCYQSLDPSCGWGAGEIHGYIYIIVYM